MPALLLLNSAANLIGRYFFCLNTEGSIGAGSRQSPILFIAPVNVSVPTLRGPLTIAHQL